ncbi:MAG: hypothetical protein RIA65_17085 [Woeseia sp.]
MKQEDNQQNYALAEALLAEQNFIAAVIVGAVATLLAAVAYGIITTKWGFSYGFAAAGIGIVVGISMQYLGRGIKHKFAVAAAVYTLVGVALGNVFRAILSAGASPLDVLMSDGLPAFAERSVAYYSLLDLVFCFVAVWFAVFLAKRPLSRADQLAVGMYELKG